MLLTNATLNALRVRFSNIYANAYSQAKQWYPQIATEMPSDGTANVYGWMAQLPSMREWTGERTYANLKEYEYTLANKRYELTYKVGRDAIADDKLAVFTQHFTECGRETKKHPDLLVRDAMQNGQNVTVYDGQPFFSTAHPIDVTQPGLGSFSNYSASGMGLTAANYEQVRYTMMGYKGESGVELGIVPNLLVVPPQLEMQARRIVKSSMIPAPGGVQPGFAPEANVLEGSAEILVIPELSNQATTWYLMDTTRVVKPFVYQLREAARFSMLTSDADENVFKRNEYAFGSTIRDAAGYTLAWLCYKAAA